MLLTWLARSPTWLFSFILILSPLCTAALVNVTVDDNNPMITYVPTGDWSFGPACSNCIAKPDPAKALDGTWHDELFIPADNMTQTVSLAFQGSAIYAFCVLAPTSDTLDGNTDMVFFIDGQLVGSFARDTTGQNGYAYNVPVYANRSVPFGNHTFTLKNGRTGGQAALALFDYMVYTTEDGSPVTSSTQSSASIQSTASDSQSTSSTPATASTQQTNSASPSANSEPAAASSTHSSTNKRAIIIPVVVVIVVLALLVAGLVVYYRRRKARVANFDGDVNPYRLSLGRDAAAYPKAGPDNAGTHSTAEVNVEVLPAARGTVHAGAPPVADISEEKDTETDIEEASRAPPPYYEAEA